MINDSHSEIVLFDYENLKSRLMGDAELANQVLEACIPDLNDSFEQYTKSVAASDLPTATSRSHSIKGVSQNADFKALANLASKIEESLRNGDWTIARETLDQLGDLLKATITEVHKHLS